MNKERVVMVLAAGASTRMKSKRSKLLHPALGKSLIQWAYDLAKKVSHTQVFVLGHQREVIETELRKWAGEESNLLIAYQDEPRGTADAVRAGLERLTHFDGKKTHIFVMGGDSVLLNEKTIERMMESHEQSSAILTVMTTTLQDPAAYGRIRRDSHGQIQEIVEFKSADATMREVKEINAGFYLVELEALRTGISKLMSENPGREFYLTDLVKDFYQNGFLVRTEPLEDPREALGVNTQEEMAFVRTVLRDRINSQWMNEGVSMISPESIWIDRDVELEADVHLEPGVHLKGQTKLGTGTAVGAYSVIEDSVIAEHCEIEAHCHIKGIRMASKCSVGPFARLRPGTVLEANVHLGNFVEVKKSHLREGVKAGHLTYLGDSQIGKNSNIGAGTITCNYDGFSKAETKIGENVFVGSNTSLVAPVNVGDQSIIGAGSVISKDIPAAALAVERSEQKTIKDGATRFRNRRNRKV